MTQSGVRPRRVMWRWRRNPLKRRSDTVEAWLLLAAWVIAVVGGLCAGCATAAQSGNDIARQRVQRHPVVAVLVRNAPGQAAARAVDDDAVWTAVRWRESDGSLFTAQAKVAPNTPAGTHVALWADRDGRLVSAPASRAERRLEVVVFGTSAAVLVCFGAFLGVRVLLAGVQRRRMRQWEHDWAVADDQWGTP